ncbi:MAG: histidine kinase [Vicingaceae bacterium]
MDLLIKTGCFLLMVANLTSTFGEVNFSQKDGLPSNNIHDLLVDKFGILWIATDLGVSSYNGKQFRNYSVSDGLVEATIYEIYEDDVGRLWFVGESGQICYLDKGKIWKYQYNRSIDSIRGKSSSRHIDFTCDKNDNLKISFNNSGIIEIDRKGKAKIKHVLDRSTKTKEYYIRNVAKNTPFLYTESSFGKSLALSRQYQFEAILGQDTIYISSGERQSSIELCGAQIFTNKLYIHFGSSIYTLNENFEKLATFDSKITDFAILKDCIVVCLYGGGVKFLNRIKKSSQNTKTYLDNRIVTSIAIDADHGYWVGTIESGLFYLPNNESKYFNFPDTINPKITSFDVVDNKTLLGNIKGDVILFDSDSISRIFRSSLYPNTEIQDVAIFRDKNIILTRNHAISFDEKFNEKKLFGARNSFFSFKKIIKSEDNAYLLGKSLIEFHNINSPKFILSNDSGLFYYNNMVKLGDKVFLLSSEKGITSIRDGEIYDDNFKQFDNIHVTTFIVINDLLIAGTKNLGIYMLDLRSSVSKRLTINRKELFTHITDISVESPTKIWLSSMTGIYYLKLNPNNHFDYNLIAFNRMDGLQTDKIDRLKLYGDTLYIISNLGLSKQPKNTFLSIKSSIYFNIDKVVTNYHSLESLAEYHLAYNMNNLTISFSANDLRDAKSIVYSYSFGDRNSSWNIIGKNYFSFSDLNPGSYILKFKCTNSKNETSEIKTIVFHIAPPFWKKWWFVSMEALLTLSIVTGVFIKRGKLEKTRASREIEISSKMRELEMKALRSQMNPHFLFNALNSIYSMINSGDQSKAGQFLIRFSKLLRIVINQSMSVKVTLTEELKLLQIYIELEQMRFNDSFVFEMFVDDTLEPDLLLVPSFIIQPFVENAIIHGLKRKKGDDKKLQLLIRDAGDKIECKVIDNGVGRAQAALNKSAVGDTNKSVAMSNTSRRLEMVNMGKEDPIVAVELIDLLDEARNPKGTEVILRIIKEEIEESELQRLSLERTA